MAENLIETPLPTGTPFAADLADFGAGEGNVQHIKIADATPGGTNGLAIDADGQITTKPAPAFHGFSVGIMGELALGEASYSAGEQLSGGADSSPLEAGVYRCSSVKLVTQLGTELPDGIGLAITPFTAASPPTWGADGDPYAPPASIEALYTQWVTGFDAPMGSDAIRVSLAPTIFALDAGADTLRLVPFTLDAIPSVTTSDALIVVMYLERLGAFIT